MTTTTKESFKCLKQQQQNDSLYRNEIVEFLTSVGVKAKALSLAHTTNLTQMSVVLLLLLLMPSHLPEISSQNGAVHAQSADVRGVRESAGDVSIPRHQQVRDENVVGGQKLDGRLGVRVDVDDRTGRGYRYVRQTDRRAVGDFRAHFLGGVYG